MNPNCEKIPGIRARIDSTAQLNQALGQMGRMQEVLENFRIEILPKNPRNFAVFAEGPLDEIRKLLGEIDDYLSRLAPAESTL